MRMEPERYVAENSGPSKRLGLWWLIRILWMEIAIVAAVSFYLGWIAGGD